jgi:hypothetical protein
MPAADAAGDDTYEGFIDQPVDGSSLTQGALFDVSGWIVDTFADGWSGIDGVEVLLGGTLLAQGAVGLERSDVAAATSNPYWGSAGFSVSVPTDGIAPGQQVLTVQAHTPGKGSWFKTVPVTVTGGVVTNPNATEVVLNVISPTSGDRVLANKSGIIHGVAYDTRTRPELGVGVGLVQAFLDGPRGTAGSQHLGDAVPASDTTWSIAWEPTRFDSVKHHILFIYAHSNVTGEDLLVNQEIDLITCPNGC